MGTEYSYQKYTLERFPPLNRHSPINADADTNKIRKAHTEKTTHIHIHLKAGESQNTGSRTKRSNVHGMASHRLVS